MAECLTRGVLPKADLQQSLVDMAGKTLAVQYPKPLLAGLCAVQGMLLEQVLENDFTPQEADKDLLRRCQDVGDERLLCLIKAEHLTDVLTGIYWRGASQFAPDAPPLWKRTWDASRHKQALEPLQNLRRIALRKGNAKRVTELTYELIQVCLSEPDTTEPSNAYQVFVEPYTTKASKLNFEQAKVMLYELKDQGIEQFHRSAVQLELALETERIQEETEEKQQAAKNRGVTKPLQEWKDLAFEKVWEMPSKLVHCIKQQETFWDMSWEMQKVPQTLHSSCLRPLSSVCRSVQ
ncbi:MAG: hypothetical protein AAGJ35_13945, partial [Myxococcota bacterium]